MNSALLTDEMYLWWKEQLANIKNSNHNNLSLNEEVVNLCSQGISYSLGFRNNDMLFVYNIGLEEKFKENLSDSIHEKFKDMPKRERTLYDRFLFKLEVCLEYHKQSSCNVITILAKIKPASENNYLNDLFESIRTGIIAPVHTRRLSLPVQKA